MTCRKARKLMALFVGDDLGPRRTRAVRGHLERCPGCRSELEAFRAALAEIRAEAGREALPDWSAAEWRALMARATGGTREIEAGRAGPEGRHLRPRWAAAAAFGALIGLTALALLLRRPPTGEGGPMLAGRAAGEQDVVSMTMVSQETGLQVVWFFDKNFDYKGERE